MAMIKSRILKFLIPILSQSKVRPSFLTNAYLPSNFPEEQKYIWGSSTLRTCHLHLSSQ